MNQIISSLIIVTLSLPASSLAADESYAYQCNLRNPEIFGLQEERPSEDRFSFKLDQSQREQVFTGTLQRDGKQISVTLQVRAQELKDRPRVFVNLVDRDNKRVLFSGNGISPSFYIYNDPANDTLNGKWENTVGVECSLLEKKSKGWRF